MKKDKKPHAKRPRVVCYLGGDVQQYIEEECFKNGGITIPTYIRLILSKMKEYKITLHNMGATEVSIE